ncbi:MAG: sensor histidine kinase, partial [Bacteroidales bacterium]|nr:sensor histidine kinase [Bacteroidales bacterium]
MKTTPRQLAILISLIISFVCATLVIMSLFLDIVHPLLMIIASIVIAFIIAFFLIYYAVNNFIFGKINPIYKTIENIPITKDELRKKLEGKDVIQEVNRMVINYAQNRAKEIKKLRRMEKYRKEFLGNVSHELKTPIFNIQGYILTLLDGGLEDPEINREYLERTEKSINRMVSIIEDLESITKLETGKLALEWEDFDIVQLVKYVYELQDSIRARFNIDFAFDRSYDKPIVVVGDKKRITEVLNNLIVNSIFYGNKGGKTTISFAEMGENILVDVTDNGLGLEEDEIPRIFERFYRTDK